MPEEKKGITVKVDAQLHAEVHRYLESHGMTMGEFVSQALEDELHPKQKEEVGFMGEMRTLAFQVPEELFQRIKAYLDRHHMTQKAFMLGLIEAELEQDEAMTQAEEDPNQEESEENEEDEDYEEEPDEEESEEQESGMAMGM